MKAFGLNDVVFEGKVYSGIDSTGNEVFLIERNGEAMFIHKPTQYVVETKNEDVKYPDEELKYISCLPKQKPDIVEVVRYFRRYNRELHQIESSGGVTAICQLNYRTNKMKVFPAFCSDDENFNKKIGLDVATINNGLGRGIEISFDKKESIARNLDIAIEENEVTFLSNCERANKSMMRQFKIFNACIKNETISHAF